MSQGVRFRFSDCRSMVNTLLNHSVRIDKHVQLSRNFRSHNGILDVANVVVGILTKHFEGSVDKCRADCGLSNGPRPQVFRAWTSVEPISVLNALVHQNQRRRVLVWDDMKKEFHKGLLVGLVHGIRGFNSYPFTWEHILFFRPLYLTIQ